MMRFVRVGWQYRTLATALGVVLALGLLATVVLCLTLTPGSMHTGQQGCQHQPWALSWGLWLPLVTTFTWLPRATYVMRFEGHPIRTFNPPRRALGRAGSGYSLPV